MSTLSPRVSRALFWLAPVLICILIMLPRLISPQFGLMDDGRSLLTAQKAVAGEWDMSVDVFEGRSRPVYWLYFTAVYALAGQQAGAFFAANTLVLIVTVLSLIAFVRALGGSDRQAWLSGVLLALSAPVIETFYTLSKGETTQVMFLALSLWLATRWPGKRPLTIGLLWIVNGFVLWAAHAAKEASLVILPIAFVWATLAWWRERQGRSFWRWNFATAGVYAALSLISVIAFWLMRAVTVSSSLTGGSYTNQYALQWGALMASAVRWAGWLGRDFAFLLPLLLLAVIIILARRCWPAQPFWVESLIWVAAWVALYLPWELMAGYYVMPVALGLALLGAVLIEIGLDAWGTVRGGLRATAGGLLILAGLLFTAGLFTTAANGRVQRAIDATNGAMAAYLAADAPPGADILLNIQYENDYRPELERRLALAGRPDLKVYTFAFQDVTPGDATWIIMPLIENQPPLTVRMGVVAATQAGWNSTLADYLAEGDWKLVTRIEESFRLTMLNLPRLFCPWMPGRGFCQVETPLLDLRPFLYGWEIYQMEAP